jgi:hypothetical protein
VYGTIENNRLTLRSFDLEAATLMVAEAEVEAEVEAEARLVQEEQREKIP